MENGKSRKACTREGSSAILEAAARVASCAPIFAALTHLVGPPPGPDAGWPVEWRPAAGHHDKGDGLRRLPGNRDRHPQGG
jgi:hypothetical protein